MRHDGRRIAAAHSCIQVNTVFTKWAAAAGLSPGNVLSGKRSRSLWDLCVDRALCSYAIDDLTLLIQRYFEKDFSEFVESRKALFENASCDLSGKRLFGALRPLYRSQTSGASVVRDKNGNLTQTLRETKQAIADHFATSLEAEGCSMNSLISKDRAANLHENSSLSIELID